MKFQPGDKVLILHSNEEGEVVDIINDKMVMVEVRGVNFPAYIDQLDFPYYKQFTQTKIVPEKKNKKYIDQLPKEKQAAATKFPPGISLMFLPKFETDEFGDDVVASMKVHLINGNDTAYNFHYKVSYFGKHDFELKNQLFSNKDFYLHDIAFSDLSDSPVFECTFSLITPDKSKADHYDTSLKLKPQQLFKKIETIKQQGEPSFSYKLFDTYPNKTIEEPIDIGRLASKYNVYDASKAKQHLPPSKQEVDLHIERLRSDWQSMDNLEILSWQLKEFEKYYDLAIAHHQPSIIFIHGVGSGRLRDEIHEQLRLKKEVKYFVNQYHPSYGYGATEVYFQY